MREELKKRGMDHVLLTGGGIIPGDDMEKLEKLGYARLFGPGTTTDSIAARVADHLGAAELALLKSADLPPGTDRTSAARLGLVDPLFPLVARGLGCVTYRNLRDPSGAATPLPP